MAPGDSSNTPGVVTTPATGPAYGISGRYLFFDEVRLASWVSLETVSGRQWVALDETTGPVSVEGRWIRIDEGEA
jgi:hypothetical protein